MNFHRLHALLLHSWYHATHSLETQIDLFWLPLIQFLIFGLISKVISNNQPEMAATLLLGFILWEVVQIVQYCITVTMMWEIWSKSFNNLFVAPLDMNEWMFAQMISSCIKMTIVLSTLCGLGWLFFRFSLFPLGAMTVIYVALLTLFGFAAGFVINGLIIRFGTNIQSFAWGLIYLFQPISAVFYPVDALPLQIRWISYASPITYVMEAVRSQYMSGVILWHFLGYALIIDIICCVAAWFFLQNMYQRARKTGEFARLGN